MTQRPKSKKQLQSRIGLLNWFRPYIPNLSKHMKPITDLLSLKTTENHSKDPYVAHWGSAQTEALNSIVNQIEQHIVLSYPNYNSTFELQTDASDYAIGAVLIQPQGIIGIFSKKLLPAEQNYTTEEKELLAIIKALEHFHLYISGVPVIVKTDHRNLLIDRPQLTKSRAERFKQLLAGYDVRLQYIPGKDNILADYLSREIHKPETAPIPSTSSKSEETDIVLITQEKKQKMTDEHWVQEQFDRTGHPGVRKLYNTIKAVRHIPNLKKILTRLRTNCTKCQQYTQARTHTSPSIPLGHLSTDTPMQHISSDIVGPYDVSKFLHKTATKKKFYILTITDRCTRWTELHRLNTISSAQVIKALHKWISTHGKPISILHDQGRQYTSDSFKQFLEREEIRQVNTSPYNPTGNAISERINQEITFTLAHNQNTTIKKAILLAERRLQQTYHRTINATPWELVNGYHPLDPHKTPINIQEKLQFIKDKVSTQNKAKPNINYTLEVGDLVTVKENAPGKLDTLWTKPYTITQLSHDNTVTLTNNKGKTIHRNLHQIRLLRKHNSS